MVIHSSSFIHQKFCVCVFKKWYNKGEKESSSLNKGGLQNESSDAETINCFLVSGVSAR